MNVKQIVPLGKAIAVNEELWKGNRWTRRWLPERRTRQEADIARLHISLPSIAIIAIQMEQEGDYCQTAHHSVFRWCWKCSLQSTTTTIHWVEHILKLMDNHLCEKICWLPVQDMQNQIHYQDLQIPEPKISWCNNGWCSLNVVRLTFKRNLLQNTIVRSGF